MPTPFGLLLGGLTEKLRVLVEAAFVGWFLLLNDQRMSLGIGVLANSGDLPGDLYVGGIGANGELVTGDLLGDDRLSETSANDRQLVAEIGVLRFEPVGQSDGREAEFIGGDVAGVDVHH